MKLISNAGLLVPLMLASSVVGGCTSLGGSVNPAKSLASSQPPVFSCSRSGSSPPVSRCCASRCGEFSGRLRFHFAKLPVCAIGFASAHWSLPGLSLFQAFAPRLRRRRFVIF